ncbi:single-stranded DNA-binding protein [Streptomyces sp. NPDC004609]|uniref:single-stranded DNA-binding protein n=1 Tax=Streptomyces sp. NPDC004609 TaxID=3364704 RepID=UPI0036B757AA
MHDTMVTLVGNAATGVEYKEGATGGVARFRMAVTPRRWDRQTGTWTDGHTSFYTVFAWRSLATNLAGSVSVGEPLVVHGRLKVRESDREGYGDVPGGPRKTFVDIEAVAVGHDLSRGTSAFRRGMKSAPETAGHQPSRDPEKGSNAAVGTSPAAVAVVPLSGP